MLRFIVKRLVMLVVTSVAYLRPGVNNSGKGA